MPACGQDGHQLRVGEGAGDADQQRAARDQRALLGLRHLHGEDDPGAGQGGGRVRRDLGPGGGELGIGNGGVRAGPGLDRDGQARGRSAS